MSYSDRGKYPIERASKLGHMKIIEHEHVRRLLRQFELVQEEEKNGIGRKDGNLDLSSESNIEYVITVDGGQAIIPNEVRRDKRMAFVAVCAMLLKREDVAKLKDDPIIDPRDLAAMLDGRVWYQPAVLPLAGITIPGQSVRQTIRETIDSVLEYTKLYDDLAFLIFRQWDPSYEMDPNKNQDAPSMHCMKCGKRMFLVKGAFAFSCPHCNHPHRLSDYLQITQSMPDDWSREEAAISLRNVMETLTVLHFAIRYLGKPEILSSILLLKDGPLLLRAGLSRLVEPIRAFVEHTKSIGARLNLVGIEKNGELATHAEEIGKSLQKPGDFFIPSVAYMFEEVVGISFDPQRYRNRVQYGAKAVVRLGSDHVVPMDVATGEFKMSPTAKDLIGFQDISVVLSEMVSYSHDNALIPIKLANTFSSISQKPSGTILQAFSDLHIGGS